MTAANGRGRVLHAVWGFGAPSETFIVDRMFETERLGWEAWVATRWSIPDPVFDFPPAGRVLAPRRRDKLRAALDRSPPDEESWWLERPIRRVRPALVHAHFGWTALAALGATRRHDLPLVAGFHGYDATVYPAHGFHVHDRPSQPRREEGLYLPLFAGAAVVLATSRFIAEKLRRLGCEREIEVIPSGIRLDLYPFREPRLGRGPLRLLFVGRLVPYKGPDVTIRAFAGLRAEAGDAPTLTVIGDGPARSECEELARSLGVAERVDFRGALGREEVAEALSAADVLVLPSRTTEAGQAEGLGNVVKEALAVGAEVAITDNGGLPEVMPPERRSELVPEGDAEALRARLESIASLREQWPRRAREGRAWVESEFDWRKLGTRLAAVYERVGASAEAGGRGG